MSVFDFPRIHVAGRYVVDPPTANNDVLPASYLSDTAEVRAVAGPMDDEQFRTWITGLNELGLLRSSWNYYGDMSVRFLDVAVTGVQLGPGPATSDPARDPLVGAGVSIDGCVMCDIDPEGIDATQIFTGGLHIDAPGALTDRLFLSRPPTRATLRLINFCRNVSFKSAIGASSSAHAGGGSAVFQLCAPVLAEDLEQTSHLTAGAGQQFHKLLADTASPAMVALTESLRKAGSGGLVFRFSLYLTHPLVSDPVLAAAFAQGQPLHNPSYGRVCGTIGLWRDGEPASVTMGRFLRPAGTFANPYLGGAPYELGPAVAHLDPDGSLLSVDLVNSLPEDGISGKKFDLSVVSMGVRAATTPGTDPATNTSPVTTIGVLTNDRETYLRQGGMYDFPLGDLPAEHVSLLQSPDHELVLLHATASPSDVLLSESEFMVASDCTASYLEQPPPGLGWDHPDAVRQREAAVHAAFNGSAPIIVYRRGRPATGEVQLTVELWKMTPSRSEQSPSAYRSPRQIASWVVTVNGGTAELPLLPPLDAGVYDYRLVPPGWWPAGIARSDFVSETGEDARTMVRVLPYDDYSGLADDDVTFDFVYTEVLRYYKLLYPAMSERLDLADPTLWKTPSAAQYLLKVTGPELWATPLAMPRTRDLSAARRQLLQRFCRLVVERSKARSPATAPPPDSAAADTAPAPPPPAPASPEGVGRGPHVAQAALPTGQPPPSQPPASQPPAPDRAVREPPR